MASLSINLFPSLPRQHINRSFYPLLNLGSKVKWILTAVSDERITEAIVKGAADEQVDTWKKIRRTSNRTSSRTRKKSDESLSAEDGNVIDEEGIIASGPTEDSKKTQKQTRKKDEEGIIAEDSKKTQTKTRKKTKVLDVSNDESLSAVNGNVTDEDILSISGSSDDSKKTGRPTQKKATRRRGSKEGA